MAGGYSNNPYQSASGGFMGLGDLGTSSLINFGGGALGGLAGLLAGPSESQKKARSVYGLAQNRLGQSVLEPTQYLAQYMRALQPKFNMQAEGINRRLGLDSGMAQGELARGQQSTLSGILADLTRFNAQATANQDLGLMQLMLQAGGMS